ncbi:MAG TPA: energy transducer TonB [Rhizomicrobium sp.]|nr:energy transducer TonB [Rhizomicrobium sp.]
MALALATQCCVPPEPVHHFPPASADGAASPAWTSLPPSTIVRITAGSPTTAFSSWSRAEPSNADEYDFTNCDSFLPAGVSVPPGTKPTLFQFQLDPDGTVHGAALYRSSGNETLDKLALACADSTHRPGAIIAGTRAQISWVGGIDWASARPGFFEPSPDGALAAMCELFYPPEAIRLHEQGDVIVGFRIGTDGNPKDETVVGSSGNISLDDAARRCVHSFRYFPASEFDQPIELDKSARIEFRILGS